MDSRYDLDDVQDRIQSLRHAYLQRLVIRMQEMQEYWQQLVTGPWHHEVAQSLYTQVHDVSGSGATFGLEQLGNVAKAFAHMLVPYLTPETTPSHEALTQMDVHVHVLWQTYRELMPDDNPTAAVLTHTTPLLLPTHSAVRVRAMPASRMGASERLIFLLTHDTALAQDLMMQVSHFGYLVRSFANLTELRQALGQDLPIAILFDMATLARMDDEARLQRTLREEFPPEVMRMFVAMQNDMHSRLWVVRAGGQAYFTHPIDVNQVIDKLDGLTAHHALEPYRILIIEDETALAHYYQLVLEQAGMRVVAITDPFQVMYPLMDLNPDLILIDVYMPGCTGLEVAAVIRQQEAYDGIPIVFLSTETRLDRQLTAMHQGGDDFLTKPIRPDHLVSAIISRAQRSRVAQRKIIRDGLTGLLNHTTTREQIEREVQLAERRNSVMSLAFIDLDRFKQVNDTYGHSTGDRVLKSLSRVLQQRLRRTDIIGRYGGEEFAVVLADTNGCQAHEVLDTIRHGFACIRQRADHEEFTVTFSCGIASFPRYSDATYMSRAADRALYLAKQQGRNQVVLADRMPW